MIQATLARLLCWTAGIAVGLLLISHSRHSAQDYIVLLAMCILAAFAGELAHKRYTEKTQKA
jgi:hypothetical protein